MKNLRNVKLFIMLLTDAMQPRDNVASSSGRFITIYVCPAMFVGHVNITASLTAFSVNFDLDGVLAP